MSEVTTAAQAAVAPSAQTTPGDTSVPGPNGCGVCGSDDVQYVLETDVGVDAATLATGHVIRAAFCSIDCLAEKLGLVPAPPVGP
jgi:hypothetical protein